MYENLGALTIAIVSKKTSETIPSVKRIVGGQISTFTSLVMSFLTILTYNQSGIIHVICLKFYRESFAEGYYPWTFHAWAPWKKER